MIDDVPPVPVADAHTVVSLSDYNTEGLAKIYVETFDEGSFDNCGPVGQGIRRASNGTCAGFSEEDDLGDFFPFIHFCCKDVGKTIMIEYQVCDDADMDGEFGSEGDLCNTAMIEVEVQDKLAPACAVPAAMRLSVPEANPGLYLPLSLAVTFPFNISLGIPLYYYFITILWG